jgi:hypothetical protein
MAGSAKKDHLASISAGIGCGGENHDAKMAHKPHHNDDNTCRSRELRGCWLFQAELNGFRVNHEGVLEWNPDALLFD